MSSKTEEKIEDLQNKAKQLEKELDKSKDDILNTADTIRNNIAVIYIRLSKVTIDYRHHDQNIAMQQHIDECIEYCNNKGYEIKCKPITVIKSGTAKQTARLIPELMSKLEQADTIVTTEIPRLGRNFIDSLDIMSQVDKKRVFIDFCRQPSLNMKRTLLSRMLFVLMSMMGQIEWDTISQRKKEGIKFAKERAAREGRLYRKPAKDYSTYYRTIFKENEERIIEYLKKKYSIAQIARNLGVNYNTFMKYWILHRERFENLSGEKRTRRGKTVQ